MDTDNYSIDELRTLSRGLDYVNQNNENFKSENLTEELEKPNSQSKESQMDLTKSILASNNTDPNFDLYATQIKEETVETIPGYVLILSNLHQDVAAADLLVEAHNFLKSG